MASQRPAGENGWTIRSRNRESKGKGMGWKDRMQIITPEIGSLMNTVSPREQVVSREESGEVSGERQVMAKGQELSR